MFYIYVNWAEEDFKVKISKKLGLMQNKKYFLHQLINIDKKLVMEII